MTFKLSDLYGSHIQTSNDRMGLRKADPAKLLDEIRSGLLTIEDALDAELARIDRDPRLTGEGKTDARRSAGQAARTKRDAWLEPKLKQLEKAEAHYLAELRSAVTMERPTDVGRVVELALQRSEIRRQAAGLDELQAEILYRQGGPIVRAALEELPDIVRHEGSAGVAVQVRPFVSDEVRDEVQLAAAARVKPEETDSLADVRTIREIYNIAAGALTNSINEADPVTGSIIVQ